MSHADFLLLNRRCAVVRGIVQEAVPFVKTIITALSAAARYLNAIHRRWYDKRYGLIISAVTFFANVDFDSFYSDVRLHYAILSKPER